MAESTSKIAPRVAQVLTKDQGILDNFGMSVASALDGACEIRCVVPGHLVNAAGFAHGSIAFALMDTACAYAIGSLEARGVTLNANTTYVRGAQAGSVLKGRVSVLGQTRRIVSLQGEVLDETEGGSHLAAHGTFVFQLISDR